MQRICIDNHNRILYYSNPAGYIAEKEAVVDTMFQTQELESFLQKQALTIRWEDGVYDRLLLGQRSGRFDPEAPPLKNCRVWQLSRDSPSISVSFPMRRWYSDSVIRAERAMRWSMTVKSVPTT